MKYIPKYEISELHYYVPVFAAESVYCWNQASDRPNQRTQVEARMQDHAD